MITRVEVELVLSGWKAAGTLLRLDFATASLSVSLTGRIEPAADGVLCVGLGDSGFIEIYLVEEWEFDHFTPEAMRISEAETIGKDYAGSPQQTGAVLILVPSGDARLKLIEVVS